MYGVYEYHIEQLEEENQELKEEIQFLRRQLEYHLTEETDEQD